MGRIVKAIGERRTMLLGLSAGAIGFAIQGFATVGTVYVLGIVFLALWGACSILRCRDR